LTVTKSPLAAGAAPTMPQVPIISAAAQNL